MWEQKRGAWQFVFLVLSVADVNLLDVSKFRGKQFILTWNSRNNSLWWRCKSAGAESSCSITSTVGKRAQMNAPCCSVPFSRTPTREWCHPVWVSFHFNSGNPDLSATSPISYQICQRPTSQLILDVIKLTISSSITGCSSPSWVIMCLHLCYIRSWKHLSMGFGRNISEVITEMPIPANPFSTLWTTKGCRSQTLQILQTSWLLKIEKTKHKSVADNPIF